MADDETPRCTAKSKRSGERCKNRPRVGYTVCRMHGAGNKGHPPGAKPVHGRYSKRFKQLRAEGRELLTELESDPNLFDLRMSVAASTVMMFEAPMDPDDSMVENMARLRMSHARKEAGDKPSSGELALARMFLQRFASQEIREHAKVQIAAAKQIADAEVLMKQAIPILDEFVDAVGRLVSKYLEPAQRLEFAQALAAHREAALGRIARLRDS